MAFGKKEKKENVDSSPTLIGSNSAFEGNYKGEDSICIEGTFKGYIECKENVYVNKNAYIEGDITGKNIVVHGKVIGNIIAHETLIIGDKGKIVGDVSTKVFSVEKGGILHGKCSMQEQIKDMEKDSRITSIFEKFSVFSSKKTNDIKQKISNLEKSISDSSDNFNPLDLRLGDDEDLIEVKNAQDDSSK
ncbi:hypothetical protein JCM13304A_23570 [Desulfothermus okinawensis JCM 13304]